MEADALLKSRRSVRRYRPEPIPLETLREIADTARYAPSAGNRQPCEIIIVHEPALVERVFSTLAWLPAVGAPPEGQRPAAYFVIVNKGEPKVTDCASLVVYALLAAHARGIGTCWFGSVARAELAQILRLPADYSIAFVVSLGYPDERFEVYDSEQRSVTVRDGVVRVPKRPLEAMVHENTFGGQGGAGC